MDAIVAIPVVVVERGDRVRADKPRGERKKYVVLANIEFDTYRLAVGTEHGVRVQATWFGAIANEADLDSRYIGEIQLFATHTTVQLPKGMPAAVLLQKV